MKSHYPNLHLARKSANQPFLLEPSCWNYLQGKKPRIRVRSKTEVSLSDMTILPAQPLPPDVYPEPPAPPFQKDAALYSTDEPFPPEQHHQSGYRRNPGQTIRQPACHTHAGVGRKQQGDCCC